MIYVAKLAAFSHGSLAVCCQTSNAAAKTARLFSDAMDVLIRIFFPEIFTLTVTVQLSSYMIQKSRDW
jgi:hypothetical protein